MRAAHSHSVRERTHDVRLLVLRGVICACTLSLGAGGAGAQEVDPAPASPLPADAATGAPGVVRSDSVVPDGGADAVARDLAAEANATLADTNATAVEDNQTLSPLAGAGVEQRDAPFTAEELDELGELGEMAERFVRAAQAYHVDARKVIQHQYDERRQIVHDHYERQIEQLEETQRQRRADAIARFEAFVQRYPDAPQYTPDAMFRLSELYYERSYDQYFQARQDYERDLASWTPDSGRVEPVEPMFHYEATIAMMQRLVIDFSDYRLIDGAYYLLGYCLSEQGEEDRAVDVYEELVLRRPESAFAPEVWTRIGEYYFNANRLERALHAYEQVLGAVDSPFYDKALYKLAWTHYRLADPERAPEEYQKAVDTFVELIDFHEHSKAAGKERGGDLIDESIQYTAISFAEEGWGGLDPLLAYLNKIGPRSYERELLVALGDVFFDQTRFGEAVRSYAIVQARFPDHPEAPFIQDKIVQAHDRNRDFEQAAVARDRLNADYSDGSAWQAKNADNPDAIKEAATLTQRSLYSAALFHHKQAQIHKEADKIDLAKEEYGIAADAYGEYLRRFPHDKQLYDLTFYFAECLYYSLRFEQAAAHYRHVRDAGEDKFFKDAAFSTVLAFENAIRLAEVNGTLAAAQVRTSSERDGQPVVAQELPALKRELVDASDVFSARVPNNENVPNVLYKAAEVYYSYDHLDEARRRFRGLLKAYPGHDVAQFASNLIIESYLTEGNYSAVQEFATELLSRTQVGQRRDFRADVIKFRSGAMFKIAEGLGKEGRHVDAAEAYVRLVDQNPETKFGDLALNNAAVAYEQDHRYDSASKLYERLVSDYPRSTLADTALFRVGLNAERFFNFDKAVATYVQLVSKYPKSERRADAMYNAALSLENIQDYERSAREYQRYCKLFPERADAPQVCFRAGAVYEKMGDPEAVIRTYLDFVKAFRTSSAKDRVVEAYLRIAKANEKLNKPREALANYQAAVRVFQAQPNAASALYAAEAQFHTVEQQFREFAAIRFTGDSSRQKQTLLSKAQKLKDIEAAYRQILSFKQIEWTLAALFRIGQLYENFAESLATGDCPGDVRRAARAAGATAEEMCDEYRVLLEEKASGLEDKAVEAFETTITRARDFQVANKWTKLTLVALNKLRRAQWPLQKDAKFFVDPVSMAPPQVMGEDGMPVVLQPPADANATAAEAAPAADAVDANTTHAKVTAASTGDSKVTHATTPDARGPSPSAPGASQQRPVGGGQTSPAVAPDATGASHGAPPPAPPGPATDANATARSPSAAEPQVPPPARSGESP